MDSNPNNRPPQAEKPLNVIVKAVLKMIPVWLRTPAGTDITSTAVGAKQAIDVNVVGSSSVVGDATAANQVLQTALLTTIDADTGTIAGKDFATQTTLAALNALVTAGNALLTAIKDTDGIKKITDAVAVTGTFYQATQPVSGTVTVNGAVDVTDAFALESTMSAMNAKLVTGTDIGDVTINNASGASAVNIQDGGNSITVDGSVTANAGTNLNTSALALESGGNLDEIARETTLAAQTLLLTSLVDGGNSSTTPLAGGATFPGTGVDVLNYGSILVSVFSDVVSHVTGFKPQFSSDNSNWDDALPGTGMYVNAGTFRSYIVQKHARYFRMVYVNGAVAQSTFRLQTLLMPQAVSDSVCLGESTITKRGQLIFGISSGNTAVPPLCTILGNVDSVATGYTGFLTNDYNFGYDPVLDKWHRIRISSTSKQMRTVSYPERPTSDLGAAIINFDHGTVTANWVQDSAAAVTQSASYNLWITDISLYSTTDPTAEIAVQEIPVNVIIYDSTDSQSRWYGQMSIPSNGVVSLNTPILIPKGHQWYTKIMLGGATDLYLYTVINGYEEA
jgi:hypothetical protein